MSILKTIPLFIAALLVTSAVHVRAEDNQQPAPSEPTGTILVTAEAGRYTYVQIECEGEAVWYAVPKTTFTTGEKVIIPSGGLPMKDFYSQALDQTFDMVYFVGSITPVGSVGEETLPPGHPPLADAKPVITEEIDLTGIERPEGGKTIAEIYAEQDTLAGNAVLVRGKAVKVSNKILGRNWIHLQDGTGDVGSNDLVITTDGIVQVGDTITVRGVLRQNVDFGAGYKYDLLLEEAELPAE